MKKRLEPLRDMSIEELQKRVDELRKSLIAMDDTEKAKARTIKKEIARIYTIINEKRNGGV